MNQAQLLWNSYRYFPYEKDFAKREVEALFARVPSASAAGLRVSLNGRTAEEDFTRLTYFNRAVLPDGSILIPKQVELEASEQVNGQSSLPLDAVGGARRQSTRYSAHGLHEYRGKFNPQVVRAIGNLLALQPDSWVLDPFCGSGTTLLECAHCGWNGVGLDLNPLAVFISNAKITALKATPSRLLRATNCLSDSLASVSDNLSFDEPWGPLVLRRIGVEEAMRLLPHYDYLENWFPQAVLAQIARVLQAISESAPKGLETVFKVVLSDLLREVSYQDPQDLRIRRRKNAKENYPLIPHFLSNVERKIGAIIRARECLPRLDTHQIAFHADSRKPLLLPRQLSLPEAAGFDATICSPPYATALPYIDTQRLSLVLLGLASPHDLRMFEKTLVGTREICQSEKQSLEAELEANLDALPQNITSLCRRMSRLSEDAQDGFRRKNMASLVYRYFLDMKETLETTLAVTKPGGSLAIVVGRNRTRLGGRLLTLDTPRLLGELAECVNWRMEALVPMDTYHRFDIHRANSINTEALLLLKSPS